MSITTALKARREQMSDREAGFTLIELLVVVIIIGILAAIAIPVYIGVQNNAKDSAAQSDLSNIKTAQAAYNAQNSKYTASASDLATFGYPAATTANVVVPTGGASFCASITSGSGKIYKITDTTSAVTAAALCS
jgi:type IV pilus assembly protein PilA